MEVPESVCAVSDQVTMTSHDCQPHRRVRKSKDCLVYTHDLTLTMQVMVHRQDCVSPAVMVTKQCARSGHGALWKMTISYLAMLDLSSPGQSTTLSSSRTPSSSPILVRGSIATTCPTMSASSTSPTPPPGCATCSSWVRASRL